MKLLVFALSFLTMAAHAQLPTEVQPFRKTDRSVFEGKPIAIIRGPPLMTTGDYTDVVLQLRVEPNEKNRYLTVVISSESFERVSDVDLKGTDSPAQLQSMIYKSIPRGHYKISIATYDQDPQKGGKVLNTLTREFHVGVTPDDGLDLANR